VGFDILFLGTVKKIKLFLLKSSFNRIDNNIKIDLICSRNITSLNTSLTLFFQLFILFYVSLYGLKCKKINLRSNYKSKILKHQIIFFKKK